VDLRDGLDDVAKRKFLNLPGLERRTLSRPARSQSLYRLSYPGSSAIGTTLHFYCVQPVHTLTLFMLVYLSVFSFYDKIPIFVP
jgi:hypothetical protein